MWRAQKSTQAIAGEVAAVVAAYIRCPEAESPEAARMENPFLNSKAFFESSSCEKSLTLLTGKLHTSMRLEARRRSDSATKFLIWPKHLIS